MMSVINLQKINAKLYNCDLNQTLFICLHTFVSALIPLIMPPSYRARLALWGVDRAKSAWSSTQPFDNSARLPMATYMVVTNVWTVHIMIRQTVAPVYKLLD